MNQQINRRTFMIKTGTVLGMGSIITNFTPARATTDVPQGLAVVDGQDYFNNTMKAVEQLGGIKKFVSPKAKVALLINNPFKNPGTVVNPAIPLAVIKMCRQAGAGDICCVPDVRAGYWETSPMATKLKEMLAALKPAGNYRTVNIPDGKAIKKAEIAEGLLDCDVFINIPIVKDHKGTNFTCTMKNMMGACPYSTNRIFHMGSEGKAQKAYDDIDFLSQCIADLNLAKKPQLCIVDATEFITTNGPFGPGKLKKLDKIVAGTDRILVDSYCATLLGRDPNDIVMIKKGLEHGLGKMA